MTDLTNVDQKQCPAGPGMKVSGTVLLLNTTAETQYKNPN